MPDTPPSRAAAVAENEAAGADLPDDPAMRAQALWNRILEMLAQTNVLAGAVAKWGHPLSYANGTLTVGFPPGSDAKIETFQKMIEKRRQAVDAISPGLILRVVSNVPLPPVTDGEIEQLRGVFGEKLIVED